MNIELPTSAVTPTPKTTESFPVLDYFGGKYIKVRVLNFRTKDRDSKFSWSVNGKHLGPIFKKHGRNPVSNYRFVGKLMVDSDGRNRFVCDFAPEQALLIDVLKLQYQRAGRLIPEVHMGDLADTQPVTNDGTDLVSNLIGMTAPEAPKAIAETIVVSAKLGFGALLKSALDFGQTAEFQGVDYPVSYVGGTNEGMIIFNGLGLKGFVVDGKFTNPQVVID